MRISATILALALTGAIPVHAATPDTAAVSAEAQTLVEKMQIERVLDSMFVNLKTMFAENAIAAMMRDDSGQRMDGFFSSIPGGRDKFSQILGDEFLSAMRRQYPEMKSVLAKQYMTAFSSDEIKSLNSFFSTGAGQKWLEISPKVEKAMGEWGQKAGMKAGAEAFSAAIKRVEAAQSGKGETK